MSRIEKIQKLIITLNDLEDSLQAIDYMREDIKSQFKKLKITKTDFEDIENITGHDLKQWLIDLEIT